MGMALALTRRRLAGARHERAQLIVLAAGGTGGHMFPAEALARELLARGFRVALVTDRRGQAFGDKLPGVDAPSHPRRPARRRASSARSSALADMALGTLEARRLLRALAPAAVGRLRRLSLGADHARGGAARRCRR